MPPAENRKGGAYDGERGARREAATAEYNQIFDLAVEIINGQGAQILFMQLYQIGHSASFPEVRCLFGPPAGAEPEKACPRPFGGSTCYDS